MVIKGYDIERLVAEGGMASVYLAVQQSLQRPVALKILKKFDKPADARRFLSEGRLIASLDHPNIITIHDIGVADDRHYISMEYLEGGSLERRIEEGMSPDQALEIAITIGQCLDFVHRRGIIHLDVKPANILFHTNGTVKLTDFGIAKSVARESRPNKDSRAWGSPYYISPEQAQGQPLDGRADIYSLGIVLYEMLTMCKPYEADSHMETIVAHVTRPVPALPGDLAVLQEAIAKMIAKKPEDRFSSAAEMVGYLKAIRWAMGAASASDILKGATGHGPVTRPRGPIVWLRERLWRGYGSFAHRPLARWAGVAAASILLFLGLRQLLIGTGAIATEPVENRPSGGVPKAWLAVKDAPLADSLEGSSGKASPGGGVTGVRQPPVRLGSQGRPVPAKESIEPAGDDDETATRSVLVKAAPPPPRDDAGQATAIGASDSALRQQQTPGDVAEAKLPPDRFDARQEEGELSIESLLAQAEAAIEDYRLTVPPGNNALHFYSEALARDPGREEALQGLERIAARYAGLVKAEIDRGNDQKATQYLQRGLQVRQDHPVLLRQQAELRAREVRLEAERQTKLRTRREAELRAQQDAEIRQDTEAEREGLFKKIRTFFGKPRTIPPVEDGS